jgi:hypothetical protein
LHLLQIGSSTMMDWWADGQAEIEAG